METQSIHENIKVVLAQPRGFCAGVERAIQIVELALEKYGPPVYVKHEIVHNRRVLETLSKKGAVFVEDIEEIPVGAVTVFSAHGVSRKVEKNAIERDLKSLDATCPLVTKVHKAGQKYSAQGYEIVLIGHAHHPEIEGTLGQIDGLIHLISEIEDVDSLDIKDPDKVAYITQTTLSVDDTKDVIARLRERFPKIIGPDLKNICYATQNRQGAVKELAKQIDIMLVVGSHNSSNSNRLRELGLEMDIPSYLVEDPQDVDAEWFEKRSRIGVTAGASTPEDLVKDVIDRLRDFANLDIVSLNGTQESVRFTLPKELEEN
ncbi:MAG: 4-hydroxy-3-methylbut-2-enyl diphosphate reductase [Gammaproteobacteria bacterium]|nr:4-hydroxy-3-methylbut-2-enyl diphosphate reductase [Gammaproteobacteria bacterium]MCY4218323.1 4-hydroxy-3-methylbut-2-enyl diphosphate reductase [Gammaproteobacteria bacterium]MCY4275966.1 4-hydroxy-3-methylbut-2-enyl diphosphate reductase [Gammaproteobacteria bacterium]